VWRAHLVPPFLPPDRLLKLVELGGQDLPGAHAQLAHLPRLEYGREDAILAESGNGDGSISKQTTGTSQLCIGNALYENVTTFTKA
jgi:hypothetical protein